MDEDELEQIQALLDNDNDEEDEEGEDENSEDSGYNSDVEKKIESSSRASSRPPTRPNGTIRNLKISGKMLTKGTANAGKWKVMMAVLSSPYFWGAVAIIVFVILVVVVLKAEASNTSSMITDNVSDYVANDTNLSEEAKTAYTEKASLIKFPLTSINALYDRFISSDAASEVLAGYTTIFGTNEVKDGNDSTSSSSQSFTGNGNFTKFDLTEDQLKAIAMLCQREQRTPKGAAAEASLMANRLELHGGSKWPVSPEGLYNYVRDSKWFAHSKEYMADTSELNQDVLNAVRTVLVDGKRTLPGYVDEHDYLPDDILSVKNDGNEVNKNDKSKYIKNKSVIRNTYGSTFTFYSFPDTNSDPFGYTSEANRQRIGEDCYEFGS